MYILIHKYNIFLFTNIPRGFKDKQGKYNDITKYTA